MTEDSSQTNASSPADSSLAAGTHVTAGAQVPDNATLTSAEQIQTALPDMVVAGSTGEGVDESGMSYAERKAALLSKPAPSAADPAQTAQPAPQASATPNTATAPAAAMPPTDEDEVPLIGSDGKLPKMRVRTVTPVDVQAIAEFQASQKAGNKQSFVEFVQSRFPAAPASGGDNSTPAGTQPAEPTTPTTATVDEQLKTLKKQRYEALEIFDFTKAAEIEEQEEALRAKREALSQVEVEQQTAQQQQHEQQVTAYLGKAAQMFPQAVKADDPLVLKAGEVLQSWIDGQDPRAGHPSAYLYSYVEAAAELGIAPQSQVNASLNTPSTPSPVHRAPITAVIAGGNATTQSRAQVDTRTYEERKAAYLAA